MLHHTRAVRRGTERALLVADMPYGTYHTGADDAVRAALRLVKEGGAEAVKLEGGRNRAETIRRLVAEEIPVMGHVGLTPQTATALGGYRAQGRSADAAARVASEALALQEAACFSVVFEAIPSQVAAEIMALMEVPVIGIGAGPDTDGQVLVFHDLLGIREGLGARFVKRYASLQDEMVAGIAAFADDVRTGRYPEPRHGYAIGQDELSAFRDRLT
jgi:3-methyl-2-oxobutanoate hydroxymethyltransferase